LSVASLVDHRVAGADAAPSPAQDQRIFQYALVLEELQSAFYAEALTRAGLTAATCSNSRRRWGDTKVPMPRSCARPSAPPPARLLRFTSAMRRTVTFGTVTAWPASRAISLA
jgi:hypothetical protein